jgi:hypothetical protein
MYVCLHAVDRSMILYLPTVPVMCVLLRLSYLTLIYRLEPTLCHSGLQIKTLLPSSGSGRLPLSIPTATPLYPFFMSLPRGADLNPHHLTMGFKSLKCHFRLKLRVALLSVIAAAAMFILLQDDLQDKFETYDLLGYIQGSITCFRRNYCHREKPIGLAVEDKILVIPTMESADMSWVTEELPEYACDCKLPYVADS